MKRAAVRKAQEEISSLQAELGRGDGASNSAGQSQSSISRELFEKGHRVILVGLQSQAGQLLNGKKAEVASFGEEEEDRYKLQLLEVLAGSPGSQLLHVKPQNIRSALVSLN